MAERQGEIESNIQSMLLLNLKGKRNAINMAVNSAKLDQTRASSTALPCEKVMGTFCVRIAALQALLPVYLLFDHTDTVTKLYTKLHTHRLDYSFDN